MNSESKSFSKPDQEFTQFNNAHMAHVNVGGLIIWIFKLFFWQKILI